MRHAERSEAGGARGTPHERGGKEQGRGVFEVTRARTRRLRVDAVRSAPGLAHLLERHQAAWARPDDENGRHGRGGAGVVGVGLVSERCGLPTEHPRRGERVQGSAACGSVRGGARRRRLRAAAADGVAMDARRCVEGMSAALGKAASRWMATVDGGRGTERAGRRASSTCVVFERER